MPDFSQGQIIRIKEIFTIGDNENDIFYSIKDICIADDSTFFVADWMGFSVSKFNKNGSLIKRIGQRGQGPGEFSYEPATVALMEDTLFVADGLGNIQLFSLNLEFIKKLFGLRQKSFVVDLSEYPRANTFKIAIDSRYITLMFNHQNRIDLRDKNGVFVRKLSINKLPEIVPIIDNTKNILGRINKKALRKLPAFKKNGSSAV